MLKYYLDKTGKVIKSILFPSSEFMDTEPREGSLNPVTSGGVAGGIAQQSSNIAPNYTKKTYEANSYVMQDGVLYTNPNAIETAEDWNPSHWTQTTIPEVIDDKIDEVTLDPSAVALGNIHLLEDKEDFPQAGDFSVLDDGETPKKISSTTFGYSFNGIFTKTALDFSGTGYVYSDGSNLSTNSSYKYAIVTLPKKNFLVVDIARGGTICALAAKTNADSVQRFAPLVVGTDTSNNVNRYQYFNETEEDLTVYVSCLASKIPQNCYIASAGQISQFLSIERFNDFFEAFGISLIKDIENTAFDPIEDKYVHYDGTVRDYSGFFIKGPISLPSGYSIKFVTKASDSMSALSIKISESSYQRLVQGLGDSAITYTYRNNTSETQNVYISCNNNPRALTNGIYFVFKDFVLDRLLPVEKRLDEKTLDEEVSIAFFEKVGVVGDSFASGFLYNSQGQSQGNNYAISWPQILGRKSGCTWINYSQGGMNTRTFLTSASYGLPKLLSDDPNDLYVLALGINDADIADYIGSITDITGHESYEDYGDTFYGNYGRIIEQILEHAPSAKIVMSLEPYVSKQTKFVNIDNAIKEIAAHYGLPVLDLSKDFFFTSSVYQGMVGSHPTKVGQAGMANGYERLICKAMIENLIYFNSFVE